MSGEMANLRQDNLGEEN